MRVNNVLRVIKYFLQSFIRLGFPFIVHFGVIIKYFSSTNDDML